MRIPILVLLVTLSASVHAAEVASPRALIEGVAVELVAAEPDIVTPVGMAFDNEGRLLIVESHTHQRQDDYDGPKLDRIRTLSDSDGDGELDTWGTFAEGFTFALNLAVHPETGEVYLVCRNDVRVLRDTDGDGVADEDEVLIKVESKVNYPHNGLGGLAITRHGLAIGWGENFGAEYTLIGSDGSKLTGDGGVGIVFLCDRQGGKLKQFAKGFWNPFGLGYIDQGGSHLFAVDNDPDASPPCRLIHVLPRGDYGHRFEYGRAGVHPLQAWDGELPGTLGMLSGTGEAPCAVAPHRGYLWVTSWGEHRIERYELRKEEEWKLGATRDIAIQGNADFRPTGMAIAPDGTLYFGDWVSRSYPVHGEGRIWRMKLAPEIEAPTVELPTCLIADEQLAGCRLTVDLSKAGEDTLHLIPIATDDGAPAKYFDATAALLSIFALRESNPKEPAKAIRAGLASPYGDVRLFAVRWIADEHRTEFKDDVTRLLEGDIPNQRYYLAVLAAIDWLSREPEQRHSGLADGLLARELRNRNRSPVAQALALRLISPDYKLLTIDKLNEFMSSGHEPLRTEAVRTLAAQTNPARFKELVTIATNESNDDSLRADAVAGLAADAHNEESVLRSLMTNGSQETSAEATRVLRLANLIDTPTETKPAPEATSRWLTLLAAGEGDADSGRRLFHSALGARCGACHQFQGPGGRIGPELTQVARKLSRERLIESILQPSSEVSPQYEPWVLETVEGQVLTGLRLPKGGDDGLERYSDDQGREFTIRSDQIEARTPSKTSIMPAGLEKLVTVQDLRDLLTYLTEAE